jgi:sigma-E factor negative regulatory protein RseA
MSMLSRTSPDPDPNGAVGLPNTRDGWREELSALADGELDGTACQDAVGTWAKNPDARQAWQAYHLIGDSLRSEELSGSGSEPSFLAGLRVRLAQEPVVVAPATRVAPLSMRAKRQRASWLNGAAVAAGFAAVAGVLWVANPLTSGSPQGALIAGGAAVAPAANPGVVAVSTDAARAASVPPQLGPMERDPQLDAYLAAHRPTRVLPGAMPVALPAPSTPAAPVAAGR